MVRAEQIQPETPRIPAIATLQPQSDILCCRLRGFPVVATPEERVRQEVIGQLFAWGYPWHLWRCEVGHAALGRLAGRADLLFNWRATEGGQADAIIEVKAHPPRPGALQQVEGYARAFGARVIAVTNGREWLVRQHANDGWIARPEFPRFGEWESRAGGYSSNFS